MSNVAADLLLLKTLVPIAPIERKVQFSELDEEARLLALFFAALVVRENHEKALRRAEGAKFVNDLLVTHLAPDRMLDIERASPCEEFLRFAIFDGDELEDDEWIKDAHVLTASPPARSTAAPTLGRDPGRVEHFPRCSRTRCPSAARGRRCRS